MARALSLEMALAILTDAGVAHDRESLGGFAERWRTCCGGRGDGETGGTDMEVFHRQDEAYARWRAAHPDGYVVNVRPDAPPLLHRATCRNLRATGAAKGKSSTNFPKACSADRAELVAWARAEGRAVVSCANCNP